MVKSRKFSELFNRYLVICQRSLTLLICWKSTDGKSLPLDSDRYKPVVLCFTPRNALILAGSTFIRLAVSLVLGVRSITQIISLIVQPITIPMICQNPIWRIINDAVHEKLLNFLLPVYPRDVLATRNISFLKMPLPLVEKLKIFIINQR